MEQKTHTHVRQFLGYERLEYRELLDDRKELLRFWSQWRNLFCTTMKQESKRREEFYQGEERETLTLSGASALRPEAPERANQPNKRNQTAKGILTMRQRSQSSRNLSVCSIYEATGAEWIDDSRLLNADFLNDQRTISSNSMSKTSIPPGRPLPGTTGP